MYLMLIGVRWGWHYFKIICQLSLSNALLEIYGVGLPIFKNMYIVSL